MAEIEAPRSRPRVGMATFTIVRSSTVMIVPRMTTAASTRISRLSRSFCPVVAAGVVVAVIAASLEVCLDMPQTWGLTKLSVTLIFVRRNGSARAEEGANPATDRRHRVPVVRRPGVREGERGRDRPRGPGRRGDRVQLL